MVNPAPTGQVFVRNRKGQVWGPLTPERVGQLITQGVVQVPLEASRDGTQFFPAQELPSLRAILIATAGAATPSASPQARVAPTAAVPVPVPSTATSTTTTTTTATGAAVPATGALSSLSAVGLYYRLAAGERSGLLKLSLPDRTLEIQFRKGNPEHVDSSHPEDSLEVCLLRTGLVTAAQLQEASARLPQFGGELIAALFGMRLLNPGNGFPVLAQRASAILLSGLLADEGTFTFADSEVSGQRALPLGNRWAVLAELARRIPPGVIRSRLRALMDRPVMKSGGQVGVTELRLSPQEVRAFSQFDGVRPLSQLISESPQDADALARTAYLLSELELVSFGEVQITASPSRAHPVQPPPTVAQAPPPPSRTQSIPSAVTHAPAPTPKAATPTPAQTSPPAATPTSSMSRTSAGSGGVSPPGRMKPAPPPPAPAVTAGAPQPTEATELNNLKERVSRAREQNHFQLLEVPEKADAGQVKIAYFRLAKLYHPDTAANSTPEVAALKADLFSRIGEAYRVLSDEVRRTEYAESLTHGSKTRSIDVATILAAEEIFQKGCLLVRARRYPEAIRHFDDAIRSNPDEGEFYAWRGYAVFLGASDKRQAFIEASKDISACLRRNDRCAPAHYFQGHMAKILGDNAAAVRHFKRCIETDPEHVDAQRELRLLSGKR